MYPTLPLEILDQIFADRNIANKVLCQLQLTCKQWSSVAQKRLYKTISFHKRRKYNDRSAINERLALLSQTFLLLNNKSRNHIRELFFGSFFDKLDVGGIPKELTLSIAIIAHFCPNIKSISQRFFAKPCQAYVVMDISHS